MKVGMRFDDGNDIEVDIGEFAIHADGSALLRYGDIVVLSTVVSSKENVPGIDFLPLTVEFREKSYAVGEIPGGFYKREGKPTEGEILISRLIDRSIRPLFAQGYVEDTQVVSYVLSADDSSNSDIACINATAIALLVSDIPFNIPVAAVKVGMRGDRIILNPRTEEDRKELELVVAGTETGIVMVEGRANFISEDKFIDALYFAHKHIKNMIEFEKKIIAVMGKPKREFKPITYSEEIIRKIADLVDINDIVFAQPKIARKNKEKEALDMLLQKIDEICPPDDKFSDQERKAILTQSFFELERRAIRRTIIKERKRIDNRGPDDIREISIKIGFLPRAHGSAIFARGETQALVTVTLGTPKDVQPVETFGVMSEKEVKRFMFHYNFPPFSAGEVKPIKGPSRREIGHGYLAEKALLPLIPDEEKFPYTIRIVSDILSSNGSTSMASVCGGSLALFDAGVPVAFHVAGVAMGVIKEDDEYEVITDILGDEDHIGDMDFKIAGSRWGISAVQMDLKTFGLSFDIIRNAVMKAKRARGKIIETMENEISKPNPLSIYAPRFSKVKIDIDKIGILIGPNGRNIKQIVERTGADIEVDAEGNVKIFAPSEEKLKECLDLVNYYTSDIEVGKIYSAKVKRILPNGALVQLLPSLQYAFLHISHVDVKRISKVTESLKPNDEIEVKVTKIEEDGRILVSRREVLLRSAESKVGGENNVGHTEERRYTYESKTTPQHRSAKQSRTERIGRKKQKNE